MRFAKPLRTPGCPSASTYSPANRRGFHRSKIHHPEIRSYYRAPGRCRVAHTRRSRYLRFSKKGLFSRETIKHKTNTLEKYRMSKWRTWKGFVPHATYRLAEPPRFARSLPRDTVEIGIDERARRQVATPAASRRPLLRNFEILFFLYIHAGRYCD